MKTKKIFIFILIFSFLSIFTASCFASVDYLGKQLPDFPEEYYNYKHKFIYYYNPNCTYGLYLFNDTNLLYYDSSTDILSVTCPVHVFYWKPTVDTGWRFIDNDTTHSSTNIASFSNSDAVYCDVNILYKDSEEIFFYQTPLLPTTITLSAISGTVWQTLAPLIIMIFLVVVFLVGFHKAYWVLLKLLRKA